LRLSDYGQLANAFGVNRPLPLIERYGCALLEPAGEVGGVAGVALPAGKTPAPESGAGEEPGED